MPSLFPLLVAWLLDDSEDIEAAIRGEGDEVPDGLDREEREEDGE